MYMWYVITSSVFFFQQLKQQRDKLKQYQKKIYVQLEKDRQAAKQCLNNGHKEYVYA